MLSAKPWKSEAVIRLLLSGLVCQFLGSLILATVRFFKTPHTLNPLLFGGLAVSGAICLGATLFLLRKQWEMDRFVRTFVVMLVCFYLGMTLSAFAQHFAGKSNDTASTLRTVVATLSFQGAALVLIWRFVRDHAVSWRDAFGFSMNLPVALLAGVLVGCIFLPVGQFLQMLSAALMTHLNVKPEIQPAIEALKQTTSWWDRVVVGVAAIGFAPVAEELVFRGILYPWIKQLGYPRAALWSTTLLFAVVHWNVATFIPLLLLAVTLTALYEKTNNLLAPITAHAVFNTLNFTMFFLIESKHPGSV